jgi:hypothetical protein
MTPPPGVVRSQLGPGRIRWRQTRCFHAQAEANGFSGEPVNGRMMFIRELIVRRQLISSALCPVCETPTGAGASTKSFRSLGDWYKLLVSDRDLLYRR